MTTELTRPPTNIKVCDAIMGSGKTSAAIRYMNEHSDRRFIYVAPQLTENRRIADACPALEFVLPTDQGPDKTKTENLLRLLRDGRNVAISHELYTLCDDRACQYMQKHGYTMIVDEVVDVFKKISLSQRDVEHLIGRGVLAQDDDGYVSIPPECDSMFDNPLLQQFKYLSRSHKLLLLPNGECCYWMVSDRMLAAAQEVIIMTYKFGFSDMARLLEISGMDYTYLFVNTDGDGHFWFTDKEVYMPAYAEHMTQMIKVVDEPSMNAIGDKANALSVGWWKRGIKDYHKKRLYDADGSAHETADSRATDAYQMRKLLRKYLRTDHPDVAPDDKLYGSINDVKPIVAQRGYLHSFLAFNATSRNDFGDRHLLAYLINIYRRPEVLRYYRQHGFETQQEGYALTVMLQWIWRSAIRNGEPVELYLPSRRMRRILMQWMLECEEDYKRLYKISKEDNE